MCLLLFDIKMSRKKDHSRNRMMTTKSLQISHEDVYKKFFSDNDFVCSVPQIISRGYASNKKQKSFVNMKQKLPTRMYLWMTKTKTCEVDIDHVIIYDSVKDVFIRKSMGDVYTDESCNKLQRLIAEYYQEFLEQTWVRIQILSEFDRWMGFGFSWSISNVIAIGYRWLMWEMSLLSTQSKELIENLIKDSLLLDIKLLHNESLQSISGLMPRVSLSEWAFPFVQIGEQSHIMKHWNIYKNKACVSIDLGDQSWFSDVESLPFDYGIITTWARYNAKEIKQRQKSIDAEQTRSYFTSLIKQNGWEVVLPELESTVNYANMFYEELVSLLMKLCQNFDAATLDRFFNTMYQTWRISSFVEWTWDDWQTIYSYVKEALSYWGKIVLMPTARANKNWTYFFISEKVEGRSSVKELVSIFRKKWLDRTHLLYASWRDWSTVAWVRVEQSIQQWLFSAYVPVWSLKLTYSDWRVVVDNYARLLWKKLDGLLLDTIWKKIYADWRKLTSHDLKSQATTVETIMILLQHLWQEVSNKDFPISSYSKNKNEMVWKILVPLRKLMKNLCNIDIDISCIGWLYDYYMRMDPKYSIYFHRLEHIFAPQIDYRKSAIVSYETDKVL